MSHQKRTRFHVLEDRIAVETFLAAARKKDNYHARMVVESAYAVMRFIEWPDDKWSIETMLDGHPRHFFHERSSDLGIILLLTVAEANLRVPFSVYDINKHPIYRFAFGGDRIGDVDPTDKESFASLAKAFEDSLVELAQDPRYKRA